MSSLREERLEYILRYLANKVEWCVNPELLSRATVDYASADVAINEAKQAILDWHNKQIEAVLDRLLEHGEDFTTFGDASHSVAVEYIEAERNRLNPSKSTPYRTLEQIAKETCEWEQTCQID